MPNDGVVVGRVQVGASLDSKRLCAGGIAIGDRQESHRRMLGGEPCPQRPDTAGADDRDAEIAAFHCSVSWARVGTSSPSPRLRGEGRGEGASPQIRIPAAGGGWTVEPT